VFSPYNLHITAQNYSEHLIRPVQQTQIKDDTESREDKRLFFLFPLSSQLRQLNAPARLKTLFPAPSWCSSYSLLIKFIIPPYIRPPGFINPFYIWCLCPLYIQKIHVKFLCSYVTNITNKISEAIANNDVTAYCNGFAQRVAKQRLGKQTSTER
jgi:hypothetical protein